MNKKETWKPCPGFEQYYMVSSIGRLRSLWGNFKDIISSGYVNKKGYVRFTITDHVNGTTLNKAAHRLVATAFIENPHNKPFVNHKNGVKNDNRVENLEWCTSQENELHSYRVLGKRPNKTGLGRVGRRNGQSKPIKMFSLSGEFICREESARILAAKYELEPSAITMVTKGFRKSHKGYRFEYEN